MSLSFALSFSLCTFQALGSWSNWVYKLSCGPVCVCVHRGLSESWWALPAGSSAYPMHAHTGTLVCTCMGVCTLCVCAGICMCVPCVHIWMCVSLESMYRCVHVSHVSLFGCVCTLYLCTQVLVSGCAYMCVYLGHSCLSVHISCVPRYGCVCARSLCLCTEVSVCTLRVCAWGGSGA